MFSTSPRGPFDLMVARDYFDGWPALDADTLAIAFPVEGWQTSAAVTVKRTADGSITATVHGAGDHAEQAWRQVQTALSLDIDGTGFPDVGTRDPIVGRIQRELAWMRPINATSPYEAAVARVLGQRSSIAQQRRIRAHMAAERGDAIEVDGRTLDALPRPQVLLSIDKLPGVSAQKLATLHAIAEAALAGKLATPRLRDRPFPEVLAELRALRGVGEWTSQGIVLRGAGVVDEVPDDATTRKAVQHAYGLAEPPTYAEVVARAEAWRPFRMWTVVLLHVWMRRGKS
jgi:DNA-3-methyladenine glycosylase II